MNGSEKHSHPSDSSEVRIIQPLPFRFRLSESDTLMINQVAQKGQEPEINACIGRIAEAISCGQLYGDL